MEVSSTRTLLNSRSGGPLRILFTHSAKDRASLRHTCPCGRSPLIGETRAAFHQQKARVFRSRSTCSSPMERFNLPAENLFVFKTYTGLPCIDILMLSQSLCKFLKYPIPALFDRIVHPHIFLWSDALTHVCVCMCVCQVLFFQYHANTKQCIQPFVCRPHDVPRCGR